MKPVEQFMMEKLALPRWMRALSGFRKGRQWPAWGGEARAVGNLRAKRHANRQISRDAALLERGGLVDEAAQVRSRMGRNIKEMSPLQYQIKDPRMREVAMATPMQRNLYMQPSERMTPAMRLEAVKKLMGGPLGMSKRQAVRSVSHMGSNIPLRAMEQRARTSHLSPWMVPRRGQSAAFNSIFGSLPTQARQATNLRVPMEVGRARQMGGTTAKMLSNNTPLPPRVPFNSQGFPMLNLPAPSRPVL